MSDDSKLTKKQRKALEFKKNKPKEERVAEKQEKRKREDEEEPPKKNEESTEAVEAPKKKRKTRRGKKGKGINGGKGPRFIVFVGNLPYDIQQAELVAHFKNSNPDRFRIRQDKGIAFLEFDNDTSEIQSKMEHALLMHHSVLRGRKINVELTVGGGGNSENRINKLKEKNEKVYKERSEKIKTKVKQKAKEKGGAEPSAAEAIHPSRAALIS